MVSSAYNLKRFLLVNNLQRFMGAIFKNYIDTTADYYSYTAAKTILPTPKPKHTLLSQLKCARMLANLRSVFFENYPLLSRRLT